VQNLLPYCTYLFISLTYVLQTSGEYVSLKQQLLNAAYEIPNRTHPQAVCIQWLWISVWFSCF